MENLATIDYKKYSPEKFAAILASKLSPGAVRAILAEKQYHSYRDNPVGFCTEVLGEVLTDDIINMLESVRDNVVTIARSANATGKTFAAARCAAWFYKCFENSQVYTAAAPPIENLKNLLWGEIGSIVNRNPQIFESDTKTTLNISRSPQEFIAGVTIPTSGTAEEREAKFSGKHAPNLLFILDEGDAIPLEVYKGIESCMSGGHVRLLVMFNPRAEIGPVWRIEREHGATTVHLSAFRHPNVIQGYDVIPGAVTRETTVRRINEWSRPLKDDEKKDQTSTFELPEFLIDTTAKRQAGGVYPPLPSGFRKITNSALSYMVLGQYPAQAANQLISSEWVSSARARYDIYVLEHGQKPPLGTRGVMGLDCAEMGDDLNVAVGRYGGYLTDFRSWGGIDTIETGSRAIDWYRAHNGIDRAFVDATGVGAGVAPHMQRSDCVAVGVKVAEKATYATDIGEFRRLRDQLWWSCREWLRTDPSAMLPPIEQLLEELLCPSYTTDGGKIEIMKKEDMREILGRSPNYADALCMTFAGIGGFFSDLDFQDYPN